jgi:hypothetical protein
VRRRIEGNAEIRPLKIAAFLLYEVVVRTENQLSDDFRGNTLAWSDLLGSVLVNALTTESCAGAEIQLSTAQER